MRVALAACRLSPTSGPSELYPDDDWPLLSQALGALGVEARQIAWDDPSVRWSEFDRIVIRSTWDSVDRPAEYLAWAEAAAAVSELINPLPAIVWNLDKRYLAELGRSGVPIVPTRWVGPDDEWDSPNSGEFVVKPSISAGGRSTARYAITHATEARQHVRDLQQAGQTVMVQEYLHAIDAEGELSLIFIAGEFSHAVGKKALLRLGEGVMDQPWERMVFSGPASPTPRQLDVARSTVTAVHQRLRERLVYARVDLVNGPSGGPLVLEVELIDPILSLDATQDAARNLAAAIIKPRVTDR
jgi:glutathione synthase/RimK-type ligase-like ATP-grasp enzyme